MATVVANTSFNGYLKRDELGPRPKDRKGKPLGEEHGIADGLPATDAYGQIIQDVKEGEQIKVFQGQMFEESHPAVKKWPELFGKPETVPSMPTGAHK